MKTNTLTKEQKEAWLTALKSGDYKQCQVALKSQLKGIGSVNCCLGVFAEINTNIDSSKMDVDTTSVYNELNNILTKQTVEDIYSKNDSYLYWKENPDKRDYSNVIPLIESLETID